MPTDGYQDFYQRSLAAFANRQQSLLTEDDQQQEDQATRQKRENMSGDRYNLLNKLVDQAFTQELKMSNPNMKTQLLLNMWDKLQKGKTKGQGNDSLLTEGANDESDFLKIAQDVSKSAGIRQPDRDKAVAQAMAKIYSQLSNMTDEQVTALLRSQDQNGY